MNKNENNIGPKKIRMLTDEETEKVIGGIVVTQNPYSVFDNVGQLVSCVEDCNGTGVFGCEYAIAGNCPFNHNC